ncbi:hypothetical protein IG522_16780, partial [Vibrio cholerae]|uniref:hypothetical protein n=1 Tax=Vibrio cholerae TaxID=666 RepID=UPI00226F0411
MRFIENAEDAVKDLLISKIAILTYVHHEPSINIRANEINRVFERYNEQDESDKYKNLRNRISALGYMYYSGYESEIVNYIENGWIDEKLFSENIDYINQRQIDRNISSKLKEVWGLYNNNFLATNNEVINGFECFLEEHLNSISVGDLNPILDTLAELKEGFDKSIWLDKFVALNLGSSNAPLLEQLKQMTTNEELLSQIASHEKDIFQHHSIHTVLHKIITNRAWNPEDEQYLSNHNVDEIYEFLITDENIDLMAVVRQFIRIIGLNQDDKPITIFRRNLHDALIKVSKRDKLDRYRISHFFGLELE